MSGEALFDRFDIVDRFCVVIPLPFFLDYPDKKGTGNRVDTGVHKENTEEYRRYMMEYNKKRNTSN